MLNICENCRYIQASKTIKEAIARFKAQPGDIPTTYAAGLQAALDTLEGKPIEGVSRET